MAPSEKEFENKPKVVEGAQDDEEEDSVDLVQYSEGRSRPRDLEEAMDEEGEEDTIPVRQPRRRARASEPSASPPPAKRTKVVPEQTGASSTNSRNPSDRAVRSAPTFTSSSDPTIAAALASKEADYQKLGQIQLQDLAKERGYMALKGDDGKKLSTKRDVLKRWLAEFDIVFSPYKKQLLLAPLNDLHHTAKDAGARFDTHKPGKQMLMEWLLEHPQEISSTTNTGRKPVDNRLDENSSKTKAMQAASRIFSEKSLIPPLLSNRGTTIVLIFIT